MDATGRDIAAVAKQVSREKLKVTVLSAMMTAFAGALYCQFQMFNSPDTIGGIGISLRFVIAVVIGGIYVSLGTTIGAINTLLLAEILRVGISTETVCVSEKICFNGAGIPLLIYVIMLVLFIIFHSLRSQKPRYRL